jgi:hypothetical protein
MIRSLRRLALSALVFAIVIAIAAIAFAQPDDRGSAEAILKELEASPKKEIAQEMIGRAKTALDRAARMRSAGDESHARIADGVAKTWAEAARDTVRAVEVEERAANARRAATDAGVQAERESALLEEAIAQAGRVRAQLEGLQREGKEQPAKTSLQGADGGPSSPPKKPGAAPPSSASASPPGAPRDGGAK